MPGYLLGWRGGLLDGGAAGVGERRGGDVVDVDEEPAPRHLLERCRIALMGMQRPAAMVPVDAGQRGAADRKGERQLGERCEGVTELGERADRTLFAPEVFLIALRLVGDVAGRRVAADLLGGVLLADAVQDGQHIGGCAHGGARADVDGGWPGMLEHFKREAEVPSRSTQAPGRATQI